MKPFVSNALDRSVNLLFLNEWRNNKSHVWVNLKKINTEAFRTRTCKPFVLIVQSVFYRTKRTAQIYGGLKNCVVESFNILSHTQQLKWLRLIHYRDKVHWTNNIPAIPEFLKHWFDFNHLSDYYLMAQKATRKTVNASTKYRHSVIGHLFNNLSKR